MITEFIFPLKREQLFERPSDNRYWIEDQFDIDDFDKYKQKELCEELTNILEADPIAIANQRNFLIVFSFLCRYSNIKYLVKQFMLDSFLKCLKIFSNALEEFLENIDTSNVGQYRNCLKIYIFLTEYLAEAHLCHIKNKKKTIKSSKRKIKHSVLNINISDNNVKKSKTKKSLNNRSNSTTEKKAIIEEEKKSKDPQEEEDISVAINIDILLKSLMTICSSNLKLLFRNKIIEDDLLSSTIKICFDLLEITNEEKRLQNFKDKIFEILQVLITKFQANVNIQILLMKLTTKIVNLLYVQESLVVPLSDLVELAIKGDLSLNKMAVDIIHEITKIINEDASQDSQGMRNFGKFLVILSEKTPKTIYNNIPSLIKLFESESYVIRNTIVEVIANVIIKILCHVDDIVEVETRNNYNKTKEKFMDILFERIYDKCGFCRSKVLHVFEKLCDNNTISVPNYIRLLTETSGRLKDERAQVRRRAISLFGKIIVIFSSIFRSEKFLTFPEIQTLIDKSETAIRESSAKLQDIETKEKEKVKVKMQVDQPCEDGDAVNIENQEELENERNNLLHEINKETMIIEYFDNYKTVLQSIDAVIPLVIQMLGSKNVTDVLESIELFIVMYKLRISGAFQGIKKMLNLIIKPEESIKKKVISAYQTLYFDNEKPLDMQADYLIELGMNLNFSEFTCLRELLKHLINFNLINLNLFKEVWKILLRNPDTVLNNNNLCENNTLSSKYLQLERESCVAMQIINTASDFEENILLNNADLYIKSTLSHLNKPNINWNFIKESLVGLRKIYTVKADIAEMCILKIIKAVINNAGTGDVNWYIAVKEMLDTLFHVTHNPEKISQYIIIQLSQPLFAKDNQEIMIVDNPSCNENLNPIKLSQLIFVIGHVALNMVVYAEKLESSIKKKKTPMKKGATTEDIQQITGGKEAEMEFDINLLHKILEEEILYKNLLGKFAPLVVAIAHNSISCTKEELNENLLLYKTAILSLCKLMCISQKFCEDNLPFIFELLSSESTDSSLKLNVCAAFGDFINRFPNILQKQIGHFFSCLKSHTPEVRRSTMIVISHLVLNDMLKLKGEVVDICLLLESDDEKLKDLVNLFFHEVNQKGNNVIYNVIPKALACLSNEYKDLEYQTFQHIVKSLMKYVEKDKHTEGLIEKLFAKLKNTIDVIEWRNITYCLSLLNYTEKNVMKLLELYSSLKEKIEDDDIVKENFQTIFNKFKKSLDETNKEHNHIHIQEVEKQFFSGGKIAIAKKAKKAREKRGYTRMKEERSVLKKPRKAQTTKSSEEEKIQQPGMRTRSVSRNINIKSYQESESESECDNEEEYINMENSESDY